MAKPYEPRTAEAVSFHAAACKFNDTENKPMRLEKKWLLVGCIFVFNFDVSMDLATKIALHCVAWVIARSLSAEFTEKIEDGPNQEKSGRACDGLAFVMPIWKELLAASGLR